MLMSHMEPKEQRWPNGPNVRLNEPGDVSAVFNYGFSDMMMNNLWVYDFNMLEESQNHQISEFPMQQIIEFEPEYTASNPALSDSRLLVDTHHNTIKATETIEQPKVTQKGIKGPRSKRCKRTVFTSPWIFTSAPSSNLYGSVDNQGSAMSKKKQKGKNVENTEVVSEYVSVNGVGRWLEDVGFGRYAGMFEKHEVDEEALPLLTVDDLKEMGVLAVGPRRKLYAAICRLKGK